MTEFNILFLTILINSGHCFLNDQVYLVHQNFGTLCIEDNNGTACVKNDYEKLTPEEYIRNYDYPFELHSVHTEDGYFLNLFRIPYSRRTGNEDEKNKKVVLVQHGLLSSSMNWLSLGPGYGLGFILADENFDVWLGNFRGNGYSNEHSSLSDEEVDYWKFEFHEIALYDLPAMTDYILNVTEQQKIYYIGHSLANTAFYVLCSLKPEYNEKFHMEIALAPAVYMSYDEGSILLQVVTNLFTIIDPILRYTNTYEIISMYELIKIVSSFLCVKLFDTIVCENIAFNCVGLDVNDLSARQTADLLTYAIAPFSLRIIPHLSQIIKTGEFKQYDYGLIHNFLEYNSFSPPKYDLAKVSVPVYIYYGVNDFLILRKDIYRLSKELRNVKLIEEVPDEDFGHGNFLWSTNGYEVLYSKFIRIMKNDE